MSVERCSQCGRTVDTDYDVEGEYTQDWKYVCRYCVGVEPEGEEELMRSCQSHTAER
jgi:DNA-directed RNA polymerase subunit RPC12/RpoP